MKIMIVANTTLDITIEDMGINEARSLIRDMSLLDKQLPDGLDPSTKEVMKLIEQAISNASRIDSYWDDKQW